MVWPVANTKTKKENRENAPKNVNFQNFEKNKKIHFRLNENELCVKILAYYVNICTL